MFTINIPNAIGSKSKGSNFFTTARYTNTQAMATITKFCQPVVVKLVTKSYSPVLAHRFLRDSTIAPQAPPLALRAFIKFITLHLSQ